MTTDNMNDLGKILKQRRVTIPLTLQELRVKSGVSASHIARIERGERFPSARILHKIAKPLGLAEVELLVLAGYLPAEASEQIETPSSWRLDPYVATVLSQEPVETQRIAVGILSVIKGMAKGYQCDIEFAEYARRKYPELSEDVITMVKDILEHPPKAVSA